MKVRFSNKDVLSYGFNDLVKFFDYCFPWCSSKIQNGLFFETDPALLVWDGFSCICFIYACLMLYAYSLLFSLLDDCRVFKNIVNYFSPINCPNVILKLDKDKYLVIPIGKNVDSWFVEGFTKPHHKWLVILIDLLSFICSCVLWYVFAHDCLISFSFVFDNFSRADFSCRMTSTFE